MQAVNSDGTASEEALADLRSRIGKEVDASHLQPYLTEASSDAIRHWAEAIGDRNPLWADATYAAGTKWGGIIAPPTILAAFDKRSLGYRGGLPGVHSFGGGMDWTWHSPIRVGDKISASVVFSDLLEKKARFAARMWQQLSNVTFTDSTGRVICSGKAWGMRSERGSARSANKYRELELRQWTEDDLAEVVKAYDNEFIRGADTLYWEAVGDLEVLPTVPKGPYTPTNAVAFEMARGGLYIKTHGFWFDHLKRHPALGVTNELGVPEPPERAHWDNDMARRAGVPAAYDYAPERIAWLAQVVTNWAGNDGMLKRLKVKVTRFNLVGDMTWCHGRVTGKRDNPDDATTGLVDLELWAEDHRGQRTAEGEATVILPRRGLGSEAVAAS